MTLKSFATHIYIRFFRILTLFWDPVITRKIGGSFIKMPLSHELPQYLKLYPHYSDNLTRISFEAANKYPEFSLIDIGANIGDTVAFLRSKKQFPILCVEGNSKYFSLLNENVSNHKDVVCVQALVGEKEESSNLQIKTERGTGSLQSTDTFTEITTVTALLRQYPQFKGSKLLKIDTDGFDSAIIRGAADYLRTTRPLIFFEYTPDFLQKREVPEDIFTYIFNMGYVKAVFYDNYGYLLCDLSLDDMPALKALTLHYKGWGGRKYMDVLTFHREDMDLYAQFIKNEQVFFAQVTHE